MQRDATLIREKLTSQSKRTRKTKPEQTLARPSPEELHVESHIVEIEWKYFSKSVACFNLIFLYSEVCVLDGVFLKRSTSCR